MLLLFLPDLKALDFVQVVLFKIERFKAFGYSEKLDLVVHFFLWNADSIPDSLLPGWGSFLVVFLLSFLFIFQMLSYLEVFLTKYRFHMVLGKGGIYEFSSLALEILDYIFDIYISKL